MFICKNMFGFYVKKKSFLKKKTCVVGCVHGFVYKK